jgi:anti-sigma B factor antagonist
MGEPAQRLQIDTHDDVTIIGMRSRKLLDEININQIGDTLFSLADRSANPKFVLDFSDVSHMSSSALGMLITLLKRIREKDGQLRLCNIQPNIQEVFKITRLDEVLTIKASRQDALASLR